MYLIVALCLWLAGFAGVAYYAYQQYLKSTKSVDRRQKDFLEMISFGAFGFAVYGILWFVTVPLTIIGGLGWVIWNHTKKFLEAQRGNVQV